MEDPTQNLSDKQLKRAYWYLLHKKEIKKAGLIILIVLDVVLIIWAIFGLVKYLNNYQELNELSANNPLYTDWQQYHEKNQPKDLIISAARAVKTSSGKTDIGVLVRNVNSKWMVSQMTYQFVMAAGKTTPVQEAFLLPNDEKYLLALNVDTVGTTASLQIIDVDWERIKTPKQLDIIISNEEFVSASRIAGQDLGGQASWRVENNSSLSYYDPGFIVVLYSGSREIGFNYIRLNSLNSLSSRELTVSWGHSLPTVTGLRIMADINIFDPDIIK